MIDYYLFLDDERAPTQVTWVDIMFTGKNQTILARNYSEFVDVVIKNGLPARISFDHDLADSHYVDVIKGTQSSAEKTGFDCAKWLVDFCIDNELKFPEYTVHSMNPIGKKRITDYIEWAKEKTEI